MKITRI